MVLLDEILCCDVFAAQIFCVEENISRDPVRVVEVKSFALFLKKLLRNNVGVLRWSSPNVERAVRLDKITMLRALAICVVSFTVFILLEKERR